MAASAVELRAEARQTLVRLALTSSTPARLLVPVVSRSSLGSRPPTGDATPSVEWLAVELEAAGEDVEAIRRVLGYARAELAVIVRRDLAPTLYADTAADLAELIVERGESYSPLELSVALRCTPTMVRRARLAAGRDAERGRPVQLNGNGKALGLELLAAGLSVRAASLISGTARSTLHDRARAARRDMPADAARPA